MKLKKLYRAVSADSLQLDAEKRTITFPFSSETPVERYFGDEILSHGNGSADLSRLNDGANLLWNHDPDKVLGVVEGAKIENGRGYATVRFSKSPEADAKMQEVADGILRNVSFGYRINEMEKTKSSKGIEAYTATSWTPFEVSLVSVPADPSVGIGRDSENGELEVKVLERSENIGETEAVVKPAESVRAQEKKMDEKEVKAIEAKAAKEAIEAERARSAAITALGEKYGKKDLARQLIDGGKSIDDARAAVLDSIGVSQKPVSESDGDTGLTAKEVRRYSFMRAIRALAFPGEAQYQKEAAFEKEVSRAASEKAGKAARGIMVPAEVLRTGLLQVGVAADGGNLVQTDLLASSFIEILRKKMILQAAGAQSLNGLSGNVAIPRQSGAATAYWIAEGASPTTSKQQVDQVLMSPKTVGAYTDVTRNLLLQSSIDVEGMMRNDLASVIAREVDRVGLYGTGSSGQPTGIANASGFSMSDIAASVPTFAELVALETSVAAANADVGSMKYLVNAKGRGALKVAPKIGTTYPQFIFDGDMINGYEALVSNQVGSFSAGNEHYWFGNFADLVLGFWSGLDLMVDPYALSVSGGVRVIAFQDCDVAIRHLESFAACTNNV